MEWEKMDPFAPPTTKQIVEEVSEAFKKRLEDIMKPSGGFHDFQTQIKSGICVCERCGLPNTRKNQIKPCNGL